MDPAIAKKLAVQARLREMLAHVDREDARPVTRLALRLLALTAVRPGELRGAVWSEFEGLDSKTPTCESRQGA